MANFREHGETQLRSQMVASYHTPVLLEEVIAALRVQSGGRYIDCTLGTGGHAEAILEASSPGGQLLGIDADPQALSEARMRLRTYSKDAILVNENFKHLSDICSQYKFHPVHGILFDLGLSSPQLDESERGFSFQRDGLLDMRFNPFQELTASDIVNTFPQEKLAHLLKEYGEERKSEQIAKHIVEERPIKSTLKLAHVVMQAMGGARRRIHPATRTFQALRIAVNQELDNLDKALRQTIDILGPEGRLVIISYHSLEDRLVKQFLQRESKSCICPPGTPICVCGHTASLKLVTKRIIIPSPSEVHINPRSRSAKMRVAERI
jgi:16S rRNA (cytosine1402-N4)-methyltransferase